MRTEEIKIFKFNELSDDAKETAKMSMGLYDDYFWGTESLESLELFFDCLNISMLDYSIDWADPYTSYVKYEVSGDSKLDVTFNPSIDSFTGYCMDYTLMKAYNTTKDIEKTIEVFLKDCCSDFESQWTDEYANEHSCANEYEFLSDGTFYTK